MRLFPTLAASIAAALMLVSYPLEAHARLRVVATIPDLGAIAEAVGGDDVRVEVLATANEDPHYVDARPNHLVALSRADVLIANGAELEIGWLPPLQQQSRNGAIQVGGSGFVDASSLVQLIAPDGPVDRAQGDVHGSGNPHFTRDPGAAASIAEALGERFATLDPDHADEYRDRADALVHDLTELAETQRERFASLPASSRRIVGYHESLAYFLRWLGIEAVAYVEPLPGVPPTPRHTATVLTALRADDIRAIVQESYYPRSVTSTLASQTGAEIIVLPGGTPPGTTYAGMMEAFADRLYETLAER